MFSSKSAKSLPLAFGRFRAFLTLVFIAAIAFYLTSSASLVKGTKLGGAMTSRTEINNRLAAQLVNPLASVGKEDLQSVWFSHLTLWPTFAAQDPLPPPPETIATYASDCTTLKTTFALGETVCAVTTGAPIESPARRSVAWVDPLSFVEQRTDLTSSPNASFDLPMNGTSFVFGFTVNNRGTWRVNLTLAGSSRVRAAAFFTVSDPQNPATDLNVYNSASNSGGQVPAGSSITIQTSVTNFGPDDAVNVVFTESVPSNATFVSQTQDGGPTFVCTDPLPGGVGTSNCTIANLPKGSHAEFTFVYEISPGAPQDTLIASLAHVTSATGELHTEDNQWTAKANVTANNNTPPACTILCPSSISVNNTPGQDGAVVTYNPPTTSGSCGAVSSVPASGSFFGIGTSTVTASNESGDSCSFTVTVLDNENPTITCPSDVTIVEDTPGGGAVVNYPPPAAQDNSGDNVTVNCNPASGSTFSAGTTGVACTATDASGNESNACQFSVTVNAADNTCTLTPPANITATSDANQCGTNVTYDPTTTSGSCGPVLCDRASGSFFPVGTTTVVCRVASGSGAGSSTSFTVTVEDHNASVPNVSPLPTVTAQCVVQLTRPTAIDNCLGSISATTDDPLIYDTPGTYTVHWSYTDSAGNVSTQEQAVVVENDTTAPVIVSCAANLTLTAEPSCATMPDLTGQVEATDNCTTVTITQSPAAGTTLGSGNTPVTFTATDNAGNTTTCSATVTVTDNTPPTITAPADANFQCASGIPTANPSDASADDNCGSPTVTVAESATGLGSISSPLVITRTYTATDTAGNSASDSQTITVIDNIAPTVTAPAASSASADATCQAAIPDVVSGAIASDNCSSGSGITITQSPATGTLVGLGLHSITITATDAAGNSSAASTSFTVNDTTAPTLTCPANVVLHLPENSSATSMAVNFPAPTATDNCSAPTVTTSIASGSVFPVGTTTVSATATDAAGNSSTCAFTVTVLHNFTGFFPPVGNLPTMNTVNAGRAIPVKFSLSGNKGLNIFASGYPASGVIACNSSDPTAEVSETVTAGGSSLTFGGDQYNYVWKTEGSWAGTCRQLVVKLNDGSEHRANFSFR